MKIPPVLSLVVVVSLFSSWGTAADDASRKPFLVAPYVQLGHAPAADRLEILWHAEDVDTSWSVEYRPGTGRRWQPASAPTSRRVALPNIAAHRVYALTLTGLEPGSRVGYRVSRAGRQVFEAEVGAPKSPDQPQRFIVFGDCGAGSPDQRAIAHRAHVLRPDYVMITGDIVYSRGLVSEYREKFWPVYNADNASPALGAPLLRSTLFTAAPGNHDIATRDLDKYPDALAYFLYWSQPLNGPPGKVGGPLVAPLAGAEANQRAFTTAAGDAFPRMATFSFDHGNAHWTVLDSNASVDWTTPELQAWVARDLAAAQRATWRFVSFHHPGFQSSKAHFHEQYMRILAPVFEAGRVDVVFAGHVHNYQRSHPLRFTPAAVNGAAPAGLGDPKTPGNRHVDGQFVLDTTYDGRNDTTPDGVIYLVTGAGGQKLYNPEQQDDTTTWQAFTYKHISKTFSLTLADVDQSTLTIRQIGPGGEELDRFVVTK